MITYSGVGSQPSEALRQWRHAIEAHCRERAHQRVQSELQVYKAETFEPPLPVIDRVFIGTVLAPPISDGGTILLLVEGTADVTPAGVDAVAILSVRLTVGQGRQTFEVR